MLKAPTLVIIILWWCFIKKNVIYVGSTHGNMNVSKRHADHEMSDFEKAQSLVPLLGMLGMSYRSYNHCNIIIRNQTNFPNTIFTADIHRQKSW